MPPWPLAPGAECGSSALGARASTCSHWASSGSRTSPEALSRSFATVAVKTPRPCADDSPDASAPDVAGHERGERRQMTNPWIRRQSTEFFIAAALLALFGLSALNNGTGHGSLELVLAALMGGAGAFLSTGTQEARLVGLAAAGVTVLAGGYVLVVQGGYIVGTVVAVFA